MTAARVRRGGVGSPEPFGRVDQVHTKPALGGGNRRAEQDCLPGLRSLEADCASASVPPLVSHAGSRGTGTPWILVPMQLSEGPGNDYACAFLSPESYRGHDGQRPPLQGGHKSSGWRPARQKSHDAMFCLKSDTAASGYETAVVPPYQFSIQIAVTASRAALACLLGHRRFLLGYVTLPRQPR